MPAPPGAAVEALVGAAKLHPEVGAWLVDLDQAYDQIDACKGARK